MEVNLKLDMTSVETANALFEVLEQLNGIIDKGDLLPETCAMLDNLVGTLKEILKYQCNWWSMENCNEI